MLKDMNNKESDKSKDGKAPEPEAKPAAEIAKTDDKKVEAQGDNLDDFGYAKTPEEKGDSTEEAKLDKKPEVKEIEVKATGYDKEPPKVVEKEKPPVEIKDVDLGFELKVDEVIPKEEITKIKDFAKKHGLTKEAAQEFLDTKTAEVKANVKAQADYVEAAKNEIAETRSKWYGELKNDPTFGGDKFDHNVQKAERVLEEFMPGTKKALTERGSVLPPYVMRDLAKLSEHLYSSESLPQGGPIETKVEETENDPLDFYNQKV